jgi:hypothetical protein
MMTHFSSLAIAALLLWSPLLGPVQLLKPPPGAHSEKGTTVTSAKDEALRWKSEWTMQREVVEGQQVVRFTENGSGRYSPFDREVRWSIESIWTADDLFRPLRTERTVTDAGGRPLFKETKSFHFDKGSVDIQVEDRSKGSKSKRSLKIPPDTVTVDGLAGALRSLPFESSHPIELHLLSNEPKLYDVSFKVHGRERVRTPAGEFECYKVELVPGLGGLSLFRFLVPKAYFWFTVKAPHYWVRYEGPENGRSTPNVVLELNSFEQSN